MQAEVVRKAFQLDVVSRPSGHVINLCRHIVSIANDRLGQTRGAGLRRAIGLAAKLCVLATFRQDGIMEAPARPFTQLTTARRAPGGYQAELVPAMTIDGTRLNGGFLLALLGRTAVEGARDAGGAHPHPVAATAQYLSAPSLGAAAVEVEVLRLGRTASQVETRLVQDGRVCVEGLFVLGRLSDAIEPFWSREAPFEIAEDESCLDFRDGADRPASMHLSIEEGFDPRSLGTPEGPPELPAELRARVAFADGSDPDVFSLLLAADVLPPAAWGLGLSGWVPTLQLTAYVRALPSSGPLRIRQMARLVQDGLLDETCEVWDASDRLVAQATQLAAYRAPAAD